MARLEHFVRREEQNLIGWREVPVDDAVLTASLRDSRPVIRQAIIGRGSPDTDFVVRLIEVGPDGLAINISHGILRCRYRLGYEQEVLLEPGNPTEITIKMLPVGIRFRKGSRLRLDVTSSDFPTFDRNHNTGRRFYDDAELRTARQTVFSGETHPSRLVLPVLADD